MDSVAWAWAFAGIGWSGLLAFLGMSATGQLVPGKWKDAAETYKANSDKQQELIERAQQTTEISTAVAKAVADIVRNAPQ